MLRRIGHTVLLISIITFPIVKLNFQEPEPPLLVVDHSPVLHRSMTLHVEMDFPSTPCEALALTWQPHSAANVPLGDFRKQPLDETGKFVVGEAPETAKRRVDEQPMIRPRRDNDTDASCGSCYGAAEKSCCDSCGDVFLAYRMKRWAAPMPEHIKQCEGVNKVPEIVSPMFDFATADKGEVDKLRRVATQGCRVSGQATVNRSPGTLHVNTAGVSRQTWQVVMGSKASLKHTIRRFRVTDGSGEAAKSDDALQMIISDDTTSHQYYMTLISVQRTQDRTESYKIIPKYFPVTNDPLGPGVHFRFDFDPLKLVINEERKLAASLVDWLGFFGGLIAVASFFF